MEHAQELWQAYAPCVLGKHTLASPPTHLSTPLPIARQLERHAAAFADGSKAAHLSIQIEYEPEVIVMLRQVRASHSGQLEIAQLQVGHRRSPW
jgi:hypothetical protein